MDLEESVSNQKINETAIFNLILTANIRHMAGRQAVQAIAAYTMRKIVQPDFANTKFLPDPTKEMKNLQGIATLEAQARTK